VSGARSRTGEADRRQRPPVSSSRPLPVIAGSPELAARTSARKQHAPHQKFPRRARENLRGLCAAQVEISSRISRRTLSALGRFSVSLRWTSKRILFRTMAGRWSGPVALDETSYQTRPTEMSWASR
jgi:hypothetical protein